MERLTYRVNTGINDVVLTDKKSVDECMEWENVLNRLAEYEDLEESGRLVKLPCKVGTTVYSLECGKIEPYVVTSFQNDGEDLWFLNRLGGLIGIYGKTVFLTKEEARSALSKMEGKHETN